MRGGDHKTEALYFGEVRKKDQGPRGKRGTKKVNTDYRKKKKREVAEIGSGGDPRLPHKGEKMKRRDISSRVYS